MADALRIGEVARRTGLSPKTIRYYEEIGLIPPPKRSEAGYFSAGRRLFTPTDVDRLELIKQARLLDLSLPQIAELLRSLEAGCCGTVQPHVKDFVEQKLREVDEKIRELKALRANLRRLHTSLTANLAAVGEIPSCAPGLPPASCAFPEEGGGPLLQVQRAGEGQVRRRSGSRLEKTGHSR